MFSFLKSWIPVRVRTVLRRWHINERIFMQWVNVCRYASKHRRDRSVRTIRRALIIPCDPWGVVGSRGDQAMILSLRQHLTGQFGVSEIDVLTLDNRADGDLAQSNLKGVRLWDAWDDLKKFDCYDAVYILGADVTDGVYDWCSALRLIMFYDLFCRLNVPVSYVGFSFSMHPNPKIRWGFRLLKKGAPLKVRDPVSLERVKKFTRHRPLQLVADAAFCLTLRVTERIRAELQWCDDQRHAGRQVFAVNLHRMFNGEQIAQDSWENGVQRTIDTFLKEHESDVLLLLPHDNRSGISDLKMLIPLARILEQKYPDRVRLVREVFFADEIKAILNHCDALIAGRMHICIAALSQGIPACALVYQEKFEGLWQHLRLPERFMVNPENFTKAPSDILAVFHEFAQELPELRRTLLENLPSVMALSRKNFELYKEG